MFKRALLLSLLGTFVSQASWAQEHCTALLRAGINNVYADQSYLRTRDMFFTSLCSRYDRTVKKNLNFGSETFSVYGYNDLNMSSHDAEQLATAMCDVKSSYSALTDLRKSLSSVISPDAMTAWTQCLELNSNHLRVKADYRITELGFGGHDQISVQAELDGTGLKEGPVLRGIKESGFSCDGSLKELVGKRIDTNQAYGLICTRHISGVAFDDGSNSVHAKAHSVFLETSSGNIFLTEPAIKAAPTAQELESRIKQLETQLKGVTASLKTAIELKDLSKIAGYGPSGGFGTCDNPGEVVVGVALGGNQVTRVKCVKLELK